jgi:MFS superfamily sulfate permease-like transporter
MLRGIMFGICMTCLAIKHLQSIFRSLSNERTVLQNDRKLNLEHKMRKNTNKNQINNTIKVHKWVEIEFI